ncbi:hypothetical protein TOC8171_18500 [Pseudomonas syringae]
MDVLPEPCKAAGKQPVGLLRGVLADQNQLSVGGRDFLGRFGRQASQKRFGTRQPQTVYRDFEALGLFGQAMSVMIGLAHHAEHQRRAFLHHFGDFTQRAAAVVQR